MIHAYPIINQRVLSAAIAIAFAVTVFALTESVESTVRTVAFLALPLLCIWYPDVMGRLTGHSFGIGRPAITGPTPSVFVSIGGWLLLIAGVCTFVFVQLAFAM